MTTQERPVSEPTVAEQREPTEPLKVSPEAAPSNPQTQSQSDPSVPAADERIEPAADERREPPAAQSPEDLFADDELADLRGRWASVQAAFVDDPKDCVQKADGLVSDLVDQLTSGFARARTRLEEQWARGEEASTEDLRVALMHYREFFQRLLAV